MDVARNARAQNDTGEQPQRGRVPTDWTGHEHGSHGFRLGYGGGFYDRTLERLRARRRTVAIGFAYAAQRLDALPIEPTDQRLDLIVTENGVRDPNR